MTTNKQHMALKGSERAVVAGAKVIGAANPEKTLRITVLLRSRAETEHTGPEVFRAALEKLVRQHPSERKYLTRQEFLSARGASEEDAGRVKNFAEQYDLTVVETNLHKRSVVLEGSSAEVSEAFQVELLEYDHPKGSFRGRTGPVYIPAELEGIVTAVLGLDNRPQAKPHFRIRPNAPGVSAHAQQTANAFTPLQVGSAYNFPKNADGSGQCIGIIELGGGYQPSDISYYFQNVLNLSAPTIVDVPVDGAANTPGGADDGEVLLDIEVAGAIAPKSTIAVYFAPNSDQGFYDAIAGAVHDAKNNPSVISISWGGSESEWSQQSLAEFNKLLQDAASLGVTVCIASGDDGSTDGATDGLQHVDFPASSPYALACGGTRLTAANNTITAEVVWNELAEGRGATGGGVSDVFPKPDYQANTNVPPTVNPGNFAGRGMPDVAGDADPFTGYNVYVDGKAMVIGGTSAVAPLWAGLIALCNQSLGRRTGNLTSVLYSSLSNRGVLHGVTIGNNGAYTAGPGWNACTGWGTPDGTAILAALGAQTTATP
ncbi:MAG TPA: S53 family peptidase [Candidatus Sulfotelmatobacter sp.]